jgi:hypothetical protein
MVAEANRPRTTPGAVNSLILFTELSNGLLLNPHTHIQYPGAEK